MNVLIPLNRILKTGYDGKFLLYVLIIKKSWGGEKGKERKTSLSVSVGQSPLHL